MTDERKHKGSAADRKGVAMEYVVIGLVLFCTVLISVATVVGGILIVNVSKNTERSERAIQEIGDLEAANSKTNRATAFRLCTRDVVNRASLHAFIRGLEFKGAPVPPQPPTERAFRLKYSRALMGVKYLPILDCTPNLEGHGAKPLPLASQEDFVKAFVEGRLSNVELGICPESRIGGAGDQAQNC